jgi:predicted dehydrogenase
MASPLRFGVLGAARIAPKALIAPISKIDSAVVTRVAARDKSRAAAFAAENGIPEVSESYEALVGADDVDVVYNPLPMHLHKDWTIAALRAGKHVLCEKPFASNAAEAAEMIRVAEETGQILGEAFHHWYHPMFQQVLRLIEQGTIGEVTRAEGYFNISIPEEFGGRPDIRWDYDASGGSLMDLGCYPTIWVRHAVQASFAGEEPTVVSASATERPPKIDADMAAELSFASGATARVESSMIQSDGDVRLEITGTAGSITAINPLAPQNGNTLTVRTATGESSGPIEAGSTYEHMCRAFVDHVQIGTPFFTSGAESVANMAAIDAMYQAAGLPLRGH